MDKIPDQVGYLVLNEEGAVISSSGELENDERTADVIMGLLSLTSEVDPVAFPEAKFKKVSITYDDHCYVICLSNRKIHVVKRKFSEAQNITNNIAVNA